MDYFVTVTTVSEVKASNLISPPPLPPVTARTTINEVATLSTRPHNQPLPLIKQINEEVRYIASEERITKQVSVGP